jgi:lipopolysaccharide/colanic/teichoic acid biosynthesis glycosyltransferase
MQTTGPIGNVPSDDEPMTRLVLSEETAGQFSFPRPDVPWTVLGNGVSGAERLRVWADRFIALVLLICAGPLLAVIAWRIRRDGGPATFSHFRVGCGGRVFACIKFRTMRIDAEQTLQDLLEQNPALRTEWQRDHKLSDDPRITPFGKWLRRFSLDELPQLVNVLRGEMALIGPRPITLDELHRYGHARWHYLSVLPGMTGLWQVSGRTGTGYEQRIRLDELYVKNRSAWLDLKILAKTVVVVVTGVGAC